MPSEFLNCSYASVCAGCDWLLKPHDSQTAAKVASLREVWKAGALPEIEFRSAGPGGTRDRVDLMYDRGSLGLFNQFRTGLVDLQGCPQMSPALETWFQEFRAIKWPIARGSIRLRVSPAGARGVWLDFANVDVKTLLDERKTLDRLLAMGAVVEIGQRRKRLVDRDGRLRLDDPVLEPWFETYIGSRAVSLYSTIGTFTQPGFRVNRMLVDEVMSFAGGAERAAEFGSGIGNFTLPLAHVAKHVDAYEVDSLALEGLSRTLAEQNIANVTIHPGNFQGDKALALDFSGADLLLVDPPRSGLMKFIEPVVAARPRALVYVSCFAESFAQDSARLTETGYKLEKLTIVDQFPQSRHFETVALFKV